MSHLSVTRFVRNVLLADAALSAVSAAVMLLGGVWLHEMLQLPAWLVVPAGVALLAYGAANAWMARRGTLPRGLMWTAVIFNVVWAVDALLIAFGGWLQPSALGQVFLMAHVAAGVVFAELQYICLRRAAAPSGLARA